MRIIFKLLGALLVFILSFGFVSLISVVFRFITTSIPEYDFINGYLLDIINFFCCSEYSDKVELGLIILISTYISWPRRWNR